MNVFGLWFSIHQFFTGLWPIVASYGTLGILAAALLFVAFVPISFIPMFLRKIALYFGGAIIFGIVMLSVGIKQEKDRHALQTKGMDNAISNAVNNAAGAATPSGVRDDPFNSKDN